MPKIQVSTFLGELPKLASRLLPNENASIAKDCHFSTGNLEPYLKPKAVSEAVAAAHKTIYKHDQHWLKWHVDTDVVASPLVDDPWSRLYFTSETGLRVTNNLIMNGDGDLPAASYPLGVPAPQNKIIATVNEPEPDPDAETEVIDDTEDDETRYYVYTLVSEMSEEGAQSPISDQINIRDPEATVTLTFSQEGTLPGSITKRRIYRSSTDGGVADFYLLAEIPISADTFLDDKGSDDLGLPLETESFETPNENMRYLTLLPNGILAGGYDKTVCFSEPYLPHAWPVEYQLTTEHKIVSMEATGNMLLVGTEGNPWIFQGVSSDAISGRKLESVQACVSKRSMRNIDNLIIYASPNGLCAFTGNDVELLTKDVIDSALWSSLKPETIEAYAYDGKYIAFYGEQLDKAFIFDPRTRGITFHSFGSDLGYTDLVTGTLFVRSEDGATLAHWNSGEPESIQWRSKEYYALYPTFSTLYVRSPDHSKVGLRVIVDGRVIHDYKPGTLTAKPTRIPPARGNSWQFEAYGTGTLEEVIIATSMAEVYG